ncbi:MAG: hypothetical protein K8R02_03565 [Anaerohalosphaeraceae bacterium]|nr:hypothetical protein [Anaerohalosphaeraceae bacterium]
MTKSIPVAPAARLLYDGKMINNLQVPLGQDPRAKWRSGREKQYVSTNPLIVMRGLIDSVNAIENT